MTTVGNENLGPFFRRLPRPEEALDSELGTNSRFLNRELSWLAFNERVLEEARDGNNPLAERLLFLSIVSSNLDEFFMVRVASLYDQLNANYRTRDPAGLLPDEQLEAIAARTHKMVKKQTSTYNRMLLPALGREGVRILQPADLNEEQRHAAARLFDEQIFPVLTPMAVDGARPFPLIAAQTINLIVLVEDEADPGERRKTENVPRRRPDGRRFAIVQIPSVLPRLYALPATEGLAFIRLEEVVRLHLAHLFPGVDREAAACFRIMRNADFDIDEEDAADLLTEIESQLKQRQWGQVIRLELEADCNPQLRTILTESLGIRERDIYNIRGPLDLTFVGALIKQLKGRSELFYPPFQPQKSPDLAEDQDLFAVLRKKDVVLHHPYESFDPVVRLLTLAAADPDVLAIKQTLYRVSGRSPLVAALAQAAENGKQVFVLVELLARFDEENNIIWARKLEQAGCHVIYGLAGLKTHSKITLIVRREEDGIRRYVHLGTGNYNDITARLYTDMALLTSGEAYGRDATDFFNMLSGYSLPLSFRKIVPAPRWLREDTLQRIGRERDHALAGRPAAIVAKINSLVDPEIIDALYEASAAGVSIDLIVRGICCLRPGVRGLSDNIRVRSLVGRFLEHSRLFYYYNDGSEDIFMSSADWMPRNLDRRIEILFPVEGDEPRRRVLRVFETELRDTERARLLGPDGRYRRVDRRRFEALDSQVQLIEDAVQAATAKTPPPYLMDHYVPRSQADAARLEGEQND